VKDLFGNPASQRKGITLNLYHDERKIPSQWFYHSFCFVPVENENKVLEALIHHRKQSAWEKEIHFKDIDNTRTENDLAVRWINYFGAEGFNDFYFYLLGINLQQIEKQLWRSDTRDHRIYNRFFQIGLYSAIKWFFLNSTVGYSSVVLNRIFSHKRSHEDKDAFHTKPIFETLEKSLDRRESISFNSYRIVEVNSDHEEEPDNPSGSHLIQFVDIIMGTFSQIYDNTSNQQGKKLCADAMLRCGLPKKIAGVNPNSRYYKKYALSFFPLAKISKKDFLGKTLQYFQASQFYSDRDMAYTAKGQMVLFST